MARIACLLSLCALVACGSATRPFDDGGNGPPDARVPDASNGPPDAMQAAAPTPSREVVNGAGRLTGATYTLDVEIGHPVSQAPAMGATYTIEGNAAVKP